MSAFLDGARLQGETARLRRGSGAEAPPELLARIVLAALAEPGDGVMGRLLAALGAEPLLAVVAGGDDAAALVGAAGSVGAELGAREAASALARWRPRLDAERIAFEVRQAARVGAQLLVPGDVAWPAPLDELEAHAPLVLWVRGALDAPAEASSIALVGARAASRYGEQVAIESAAGLVDRGCTIVSGGAYGIDGAAHRSALASGGTTVAYLAGGIDRFYPAGHAELLGRIAEHGAVVSEVPPGSAPTKWRFLMRNRLIAAASLATVVIEAGHRSGSLNTAGHAASLGRPLGAVPGPVTSPASAGCHRLLREYDAVCVTDAAQMAELAGIDEPRSVGAPRVAGAPRADGPPPPAEASRADRGAGERALRNGAAAPVRGPAATRLGDALSTRAPRDVGELVRRSGLEPGLVMAELGRLQLEGRAVRRGDGWLLRPAR